jgi:hypothetical protein
VSCIILHETNPAFTAPIVRWNGRTWLDTDPAALSHPSAQGQQFRLGNDLARHTVVRATPLGGRERVLFWMVRTTEREVPMLLSPQTQVWLEIDA